MPEELKQAAQAALDQLEFLNACYPHKTATDAADALRRALTQRPAAQPAGHDCVYRAEPLQPGDTNGPQTAACMTCGQPPRVLGATQQATPAQEVHPLASRCYAMSEPHLSGYRLVLGFETLEAVGAAHTWVANVRKAPQQATPEPVGWTDADADAARLAMELECLLLDTKDTAAVSRWWKSANEALDLHRARLAAAQAKGAEQ